MVSPSAYFVEKHLIVSEGSDPVCQAVEEDQGLQGDLTETSDQTQPELRMIRIEINYYYDSLTVSSNKVIEKLNFSPGRLRIYNMYNQHTTI